MQIALWKMADNFPSQKVLSLSAYLLYLYYFFYSLPHEVYYQYINCYYHQVLWSSWCCMDSLFFLRVIVNIHLDTGLGLEVLNIIIS